MSRTTKQALGWTYGFALACTLTGCATLAGDPSSSIGTQASHMLNADARYDSPEFRFLDFKYLLKGKQISGYWRSMISQPGFNGLASVGMESSRVGDAVYVKWRHTSTGTVYEKTVSLQGRLAIPIQEGGQLHFVLAHEEPHIYIAAPRPDYAPTRPNAKPGTICKDKRVNAQLNPTPDSLVSAFYCGRIVWKVYPEQKQINFALEQL